ncbi:hypothetical protein METBIDRAFT_30307 [Metschnikowia bicuspidata var. bicuspidata NRRL YB-4993]|uniref:Uncharacterized protein n=1 Tax=Metschnikowia bicuspidata var. bicuspidata NRRL YB-4993 TaxID=869754 RepID=A0A1A0HJD2_9ASCO|nr:hypothetical protein METBIDRAFT_30307 [Metschnikowia bicuspidata var. bicuspidata NRRL YB-4993]OBA23948.1 hypothetical protein METBIDRAFT_30307 [Metschnikowia bicuspidata var. bicuspidata NRRL YB-4993]
MYLFGNDQPEPKRRKLEIPLDAERFTSLGTVLRTNGTISPCQVSESDTMEICEPKTKKSIMVNSDAGSCPCGYLHGPGISHIHDITAVGFSSNMLRGPD